MTSEKEALETQVRDYYAPMLAELEGMDRDEAIITCTAPMCSPGWVILLWTEPNFRIRRRE